MYLKLGCRNALGPLRSAIMLAGTGKIATIKPIRRVARADEMANRLFVPGAL